MGLSPKGQKQKTYYVREDLAKVIAMVASRDDKKESELVNEALIFFIESNLSKDEKRVFGYKNEGESHGSIGTNGHRATVQSNGQSVQGTGSAASSQPIPKKRLRKADGA